ncbi:hypothetical protein X777_14600, partial [Ooceraea biroi]
RGGGRALDRSAPTVVARRPFLANVQNEGLNPQFSEREHVVRAPGANCTAKHFCRLPWLQDNHHFFPPS